MNTTPTVTVTVTNELGTFTADPLMVDLMIARHLPASPRQIARLVAADYDDPADAEAKVRSVTEGLVMLADAEDARRANARAAADPLRDVLTW